MCIRLCLESSCLSMLSCFPAKIPLDDLVQLLWMCWVETRSHSGLTGSLWFSFFLPAGQCDALRAPPSFPHQPGPTRSWQYGDLVEFVTFYSQRHFAQLVCSGPPSRMFSCRDLWKALLLATRWPAACLPMQVIITALQTEAWEKATKAILEGEGRCWFLLATVLCSESMHRICLCLVPFSVQIFCLLLGDVSAPPP